MLLSLGQLQFCLASHMALGNLGAPIFKHEAGGCSFLISTNVNLNLAFTTLNSDNKLQGAMMKEENKTLREWIKGDGKLLCWKQSTLYLNL